MEKQNGRTLKQMIITCSIMLFLNSVFFPQNYHSRDSKIRDAFKQHKRETIFKRIDAASVSTIHTGQMKQSSIPSKFNYRLVDGDIKEFNRGANYKRYSELQETIKDTLMPNGLTYKQIKWSIKANSFPSDSVSYEYQRVDTSGNVYIYYKEKDKILYNFDVAKGDIYYSQYPDMVWRVIDKYNLKAYDDTFQAVELNLVDSNNVLYEVRVITEKFGMIFYNKDINSATLCSEGVYWGARLDGKDYGELLAFSNENNLRDYYPLDKGNILKYEQLTAGFITSELRQCIKDTVFSDNETYKKSFVRTYRAGQPWKQYDEFQRIDSNGNIYFGYSGGYSVKKSKLSACLGDTFYTAGNLLHYRIEDKAVYFDEWLNKYNTMLLVSIIESAWADDRYYCKGLGLVKTSLEGGPQLLTGAVINGVAYGDTSQITSVEKISREMPDYDLLQNYPNPFNPTTTIRYSLATRSGVRLEIYSITGEKVKELVNNEQPSGTYEITWNGRDESNQMLASGIYLLRLNINTPAMINKTISKKILLLK